MGSGSLKTSSRTEQDCSLKASEFVVLKNDNLNPS